MAEKHRVNTKDRQHYTFSKKIALSLKPKFVYSGAVKKAPGWLDTEHRHEFCEIMFIKSGSGKLDIGGTYFDAKEGDLVVYNASVPHFEYSDPENPLEVLFCGADHIRLYGLPNGHLLAPDASPVFAAGEYQGFFEELFDRIVEEPECKGLYYKEITENLLRIIIHLILRLSIKNSDLEELNAVYYRVKNYFDKNYAEDISLDGVCERFYVSKSYLSHIFKELNGDAPMKYLSRVRLANGKRLLSSTELAVREISEKCGYSDECYFCRVFKESEGLTPLQYRIKNKK